MCPPSTRGCALTSMATPASCQQVRAHAHGPVRMVSGRMAWAHLEALPAASGANPVGWSRSGARPGEWHMMSRACREARAPSVCFAWCFVLQTSTGLPSSLAFSRVICACWIHSSLPSREPLPCFNVCIASPCASMPAGSWHAWDKLQHGLIVSNKIFTCVAELSCCILCYCSSNDLQLH